ncbi:MAG: L-glutamate gamma-semialdehyde dehydrogenase [Bdellovibrionales bacterium]|nr:L-glutamate gamma-semialdehyde dehydrogenase [Bdellovibrionales bacterium]
MIPNIPDLELSEKNEPVRSYDPKTALGQAQIQSLKARLDSMSREKIEIPLIIGGKEVRTGKTRTVVMPHDHGHVLAEFHLATEKELLMAADAAIKAKKAWAAMPWNERAAIFLKAADLLAGPWRDTLNAATMLGQSKNVFQAEIDAACELIDFLRFNARFYSEILREQPISSPGVWNRMDWRPLEGFVLAITPFNFTAIAGNLCAAPAICGNTVVWKPSDTQMLSAHYIQKLFEEAGIPAGVINRVAADGPLAGDTLLPHPELGGVHFTGSTATFQTLWKKVSENLTRYRSYPRMVGETGGKDFIFVHPSASTEAVVANAVRGAFEYQGQKCSAASRIYLPKSLSKQILEGVVFEMKTLKMGDVRDFSNFVNAVIDERSFKRVSAVLSGLEAAKQGRFLAGGKTHGEKGYFIEPTLIETADPKSRTMVEELFAPVLTAYVYDDARLEEALDLCDSTSPYALTGAIFAQDREALVHMSERLRNAAGNFYLNDKPTGAVVGQQPFGGARASGTNDKAGSKLNLYRWLSPRTIKETLVSATNYRYPFLG